MTCTLCTPGRHGGPLGASDNTSCTACEQGRYNQEYGSPYPSFCQQCAPGYWSDRTARRTTCVGCASGQFKDSAGSFSPCIDCPKGYSMSSSNSSKCGTLEESRGIDAVFTQTRMRPHTCRTHSHKLTVILPEQCHAANFHPSPTPNHLPK